MSELFKKLEEAKSNSNWYDMNDCLISYNDLIGRLLKLNKNSNEFVSTYNELENISDLIGPEELRKKILSLEVPVNYLSLI